MSWRLIVDQLLDSRSDLAAFVCLRRLQSVQWTSRLELLIFFTVNYINLSRLRGLTIPFGLYPLATVVINIKVIFKNKLQSFSRK